MANTLADAAMYAHLRGDDAEAVERLLDLLHLGHTLRQDPVVISQLVAFGIESLALDTAQQIAPTLAVGEAATARAPGNAASSDQVRMLVDTLLDERAAHASFTRAYTHDRAITLAGIDDQSAGSPVIRPLADASKLRWLPQFATAVEASRQPNYAAASRVLASLDGPENPDASANPASTSGGGRRGRHGVLAVVRRRRARRFRRIFELYYRTSGERRATAVSFAARLYRVEQNRWPDELSQLVPKHLPAVPADPFHDDGRPLGYVLQRGALPGGGDRPLVYFDPGSATEAAIDPEPMIGWQFDQARRRRRRPARVIRQYRDLGLWLPTTRRFDEQQKQLPEEALGNDPDEADAPRDEQESFTEPDAPP